jgi:hypothetical protein
LCHQSKCFNKSSYSDGKFCLNGQLLSDVKIEQSGDKWLRKWECISNDLETIKCSSEIGNDGLCGPAAKKYPENVSDFSGTFCSNGTFSYSGNTVFTSRTLPKFPKIGESVSWKCLGSDGGKDDNCLATRLQGKPGRCGTNAGNYTHDSTSFRGTEFCSQGKLQGNIPVFPIDPNKKISWICNGIDGGAPTNCTAERVSNPCACATYTKVGTYCGEGINCPGICTHPRCLSGRVID